MDRCAPEALRGADAAHNAAELARVLVGDDKGAHRDALVMGTSLVLEVVGIAKDLNDGVAMAIDTIDSGRAATFLENFRTHFGN